MMRVGILGGGQLAQLLALSAKPLGLQTLCLDLALDACARNQTEVIHAPLDDTHALTQLAERSDILTVETENIPLATLDFLSPLKPIYPSRLAIATAQDRLLEKQLCQELHIPTPRFCNVSHFDELKHALTIVGTPAIVKTRRFGYDGKGQVVIKHAHDATQAWAALNNDSLIVEQMVPFDYEVSMLAVQDRHGHQQFYPLVRNYHEAGILRYSIAPWNAPRLFEQAKTIVKKLLTHFSYVGVLAVEFFVVGQEVIVNEMAPRVHNSGHWSIEGTTASQFENHLRAITGQPLGSTAATTYNVMFNHIGEHPNLSKILHLPNIYYHDYGKKPRPGRKIGHVTFSVSDRTMLHPTLEKLQGFYPEYTVRPADVV
jgi:5-(carboxyamino)imidazole ribonucleotide synthase